MQRTTETAITTSWKRCSEVIEAEPSLTAAATDRASGKKSHRLRQRERVMGDGDRLCLGKVPPGCGHALPQPTGETYQSRALPCHL